MTTDTLEQQRRLRLPEVLDLVDAGSVEGQITRTELELADLEREAAELCAAADAAEESARLGNLDLGSSTWTIVRLQRFLEELRVEAERDAATMIEVARYRARMASGVAVPHPAAHVPGIPTDLRLVPAAPATPPPPAPSRPIADPVVVPVGAPKLPETSDQAVVAEPVAVAPAPAVVVAEPVVVAPA
ncbi:MAG: hypothetical protein WCI50_15010, partial [Actinomycetes bacterium]